jgi:hypothetical protein
LASKKYVGKAKLNLGIEGRVLGQANHRVRRVEANANNIDNGKGISHGDTVRKNGACARENAFADSLIILAATVLGLTYYLTAANVQSAMGLRTRLRFFRCALESRRCREPKEP